MSQWLPSISILPSHWGGREEGLTPAKHGGQGREGIPRCTLLRGLLGNISMVTLKAVGVYLYISLLKVGIEDEELHRCLS